MYRTATLVSTAALLLAIAAHGRAFAQQGAVDPAALPDAEGKAILTRVCAECHDLQAVVVKRLTQRQWRDITTDMSSRSARIDAAEIPTLIEYLAQNVGHVNVNKATEAELKTYGGFSPAEATAIIAARSQGQTFETLDALKALPGIDVKTLDARKDRIAFK